MRWIRFLTLLVVFSLLPALAWSQIVPAAKQPAPPKQQLIPSQPSPIKERPAAPAPDRPANPPRLEAIAETRLLMDGLARPNVEGLSKLLKDKPTTAESWAFARGQALLLAETGNLLMLRPPSAKPAQEAWLTRSTDLRVAAAKLAAAAGEKDYPAARAALANVANTCNRCHDAFRVTVRITPFD